MDNWRTAAACRHEDPDLFFPIGTSGPAMLQTQAAKSVCHGCPVREPCLQWAMDNGQESGVWGGLSEDERRALKRRSRNRSRAASARR
ncbi:MULTISPECIES: WhiB family transcriptional regulator [unclassified Streptomyces]|uniref:WhiB family transcriptional regulator n=1 Tax=unclassified Streptomyces TaxID=2593676 RepID=UPI0033A2D8B9